MKGKILQKTLLGNKAIIECTDLFVDIPAIINYCAQHGISKEDINIILPDFPGIYLNIITLQKLIKQLEILTSNILPNDTEIEKFAKITTSIRKNIKYAHTKTGKLGRNIGETWNLIEGLLKGKCVCCGYAQITKLSLNMHNIDCEIVKSTISPTSGHAWNQVKLNDIWYHWDMTNVKSDTLTSLTMGKCLKTDEQIAQNKIYKNNNSKIKCNTPPHQSLIFEINKAIKENIHSVPKLPKENVISKIKQKLFNRVTSLKNKIFKKHQPKLLPEVSTSKKQNIKPELEFTSYKSFMDLPDRNSEVFQIQSWEKGNVTNKVRTSYLELSGLNNQDLSQILNNEDFKEFYKALISDNKEDTLYIGRIDLIKLENGEITFCGYSRDCKECQGMAHNIEKSVKNRPFEKITPNREIQKTEKER